MGWPTLFQSSQGGVDRSVWIENEYRGDTTSLYVLKTNTGMFKIGISNDVWLRIRKINIDLCEHNLPYRFFMFDHIFIGKERIAREYESAVLNVFSEHKVYTNSIWPGSTEVIHNVPETDINKVLQTIRSLIKRNK